MVFNIALIERIGDVNRKKVRVCCGCGNEFVRGLLRSLKYCSRECGKNAKILACKKRIGERRPQKSFLTKNAISNAYWVKRLFVGMDDVVYHRSEFANKKAIERLLRWRESKVGWRESNADRMRKYSKMKKSPEHAKKLGDNFRAMWINDRDKMVRVAKDNAQKRRYDPIWLEKIRDAQSKRIVDHNHPVNKNLHYNGIFFRSNWEIKVAEWMDNNKIVWEYEKHRFKLPNGRWYVPDFYLVDKGEFLEVKGRMFSDDVEKMNAFVGLGKILIMVDGTNINDISLNKRWETRCL